jgi:voltage-gated potassium channel
MYTRLSQANLNASIYMPKQILPVSKTSLPASDAAGADDPILVMRVTYNIFITLVTLISLSVMLLFYFVPLPEPVDEVLYFVNYIDALILLFDFAVRLWAAPHKLRYLLPWGLLDLVGSLPGIPYLRLLRIPSLVRTWRMLRRTTSGEVLNIARNRLAESTLLSGILVVFFVMTAGGMAIVYVEAPVEGSNIKTGGDALWYALVTIATVGYGDRYPITAAGRLIGSTMILVGVGLFSVLTGFISTQFLARRRGAAPSETERLHRELVQLSEQDRQAAAADRAALRAEIAALREQLAEPGSKRGERQQGLDTTSD